MRALFKQKKRYQPSSLFYSFPMSSVAVPAALGAVVVEDQAKPEVSPKRLQSVPLIGLSASGGDTSLADYFEDQRSTRFATTSIPALGRAIDVYRLVRYLKRIFYSGDFIQSVDIISLIETWSIDVLTELRTTACPAVSDESGPPTVQHDDLVPFRAYREHTPESAPQLADVVWRIPEHWQEPIRRTLIADAERSAKIEKSLPESLSSKVEEDQSLSRTKTESASAASHHVEADSYLDDAPPTAASAASAAIDGPDDDDGALGA